MPRRAVRGVVIISAVGLLAAAGWIGAALTQGDPAASREQTTPRPLVEVTRGKLRQVERLVGSLGYGAPVTLAGRSGGTITWLPSVGRRVARGGQLYRVNDQPVSLFYGDLPLYRTLRLPNSASGAGEKEGGKVDEQKPLVGRDVDLIAANLAALGFWGGAITEVPYDAALADAVIDWQASIGAPDTGILEPTDIVVASGPVRVAEVMASVGAEDAGDVLSWTGTRRLLELRVDAQQAKSLERHDPIRVALADGTRLRTRVTHVGGRAEPSADGGPAAVSVLVRPKRPRALEDAPLGAVTATRVTAIRRDVLRVPITALVALAEGGYALEQSDGTLVRVTLGMVAEGQVEVRGVDVGTEVVVAE